MNMTINPPKLAITSVDIRRDLILPMRHFTRLRLDHFYRRAPYGDLLPEEMPGNLSHYSNPVELFRLLSRRKPEVIQNLELFAVRQLPYILAVTRYAREHRIPLIAGVHYSLPIVKRYGRPGAAVLRTILAPTLRSTQLYFYLNEGGRKNLAWIGVPENHMMRLMYGTWGIDPKEFTPERDGREPGWGADPVLLYVGRIHPEKGILDMLEAFDLVNRERPEVRLALIGDGPLRSEAQRIVSRKPWAEKARFLGTIKHRDLPPFFRAATVFVSPSVHTARWEEYVGMTNIQAMASGVPVVSTRSGAIPEYVPESAGILAPENDPLTLAQAVMKLLSDRDLREEMGRNGRDTACERYDSERNVRQAEEKILSILPNR